MQFIEGEDSWLHKGLDRYSPERLAAARSPVDEALAEARIKDGFWHCNRHTFASRLVTVAGLTAVSR
jgi:hypothetical protein